MPSSRTIRACIPTGAAAGSEPRCSIASRSGRARTAALVFAPASSTTTVARCSADAATSSSVTSGGWRSSIRAEPPPPAVVEGVELRAYRPGSDDLALHAAIRRPSRITGITRRSRWRSGSAAGPCAATTTPPSGSSPRRTEQSPAQPWRSALATSAGCSTSASAAPGAGRGLGHALLLGVFGELYRRGFTRVGLEVDAASETGATRLYERAGMRVTRRYDWYERRL